MKIPKGYILWLAKPSGEVFEEIDLEGYDLALVFARTSLMIKVNDALECELLSHPDQVPE